MKNFKRFISIILIGIVAFITVIGVKALNDVITLGEAQKLPNYMDNILAFSIKKMTNGELVYCLNMHTNTAQNINAKYIGKGDPGLTYILENGYPNKSFTGNKEKDYYITQVAVWMYLDDTTGSSNLNSKFRENTGEMMDHIKRLVSLAKQQSEDTTELKLEISSDSKDLYLQDNYYVSELIKATTLSGTENYNVEVTGSEQAEIVDTNNNVVSTINGNDSFRVRIPANVVTDQTSLVVTASASRSTYQSYKYQPSDASMQSVVRLVKNTKNVNSVLSFGASRPSVTISKIDAETNESLAGAVIAIYSASGLEVKRFTTTLEPFVINDLADGTYTVKEISAPNGYIKNDSTFRFTLDENNRTHSITIENYKEVIVPDTDTTSTILITLLGIIISGIGVYFVRRYGKA